MDTLSKKLGISDVAGFIERRVVPLLEDTPQSPAKVSGEMFDVRGLGEKLKSRFYFIFTAILIGLGFLVGSILPIINGLSERFNIPSTLLTIGMTVIAAGGGLFLCRNKVLDIFTTGQLRFIHRSRAMNTICEAAGLTYVPLPGGASVAAKKFAGWRICPKPVQALIESMDRHGGMDDVVDIVRRSGLAMPSGLVIASDKNYERYYQQQFDQQQFEDGIQGKRGGITFSALEWHENNNEESKHHMLVVLTLPTRLSGLVEFKNKSESWPLRPRDLKTDKVKLISKDFHKRFHVRAEDQMEGRLIFDPAVIERITEFAHGAPVRGAAFGQHLVFDIAGHNRFNMVNLLTGAWSEDSILMTMKDIADMLSLVDAIASVFSLRTQINTQQLQAS